MSADYEVPTGYRERDVASTATSFSAGPVLSLPPPGEHSDEEDFKKSVYGLLGHINSLIKYLTGYDLLTELLPIVLGNSGALRRLADAHRSMEHGIRQVKDDTAAGMNILSSHWTSDGAGGASTAFDFHIRERWVPALDSATGHTSHYCQRRSSS